MGIRVVIRGDEEIIRRFSNDPARMQMLADGVDAQLAMLEGAVKPLTPVGVTSNLRGSWQSDAPRILGHSIVGAMGSPLIYAPVIERGRTPGATMPPPDALAVWTLRKIGSHVSPFVIARAIGQKGIKGRRMLEKAIAATRAARQALMSGIVARLVERS